MTEVKMVTRIDRNFLLRQGIKWSAQNYFVFELDENHPLLSQAGELVSDFFLFCHWSAGSAAIMQDAHCIITGPNSLFAFLPGQTYQLNASPGTAIQGVLVAPQFLERINFGMELSETMPFLLSNTPLYLSNEEGAQLRQLLTRLLRNNRHSRQSHYHDRLQKAGFLLYSYELGSLYQQHAICAQGPQVKRSEILYNGFLNLLRCHFREERSVEFYAGKMAVTPKYFSESIKEVDGRTAGQVIADTVVNEARSLLEETSLAVQEISNLLHFPDQATFAKYFKKHTGLSPKHYRLSLQHAS